MSRFYSALADNRSARGLVTGWSDLDLRLTQRVASRNSTFYIDVGLPFVPALQESAAERATQ
jgi:hypothetical protein